MVSSPVREAARVAGMVPHALQRCCLGRRYSDFTQSHTRARDLTNVRRVADDGVVHLVEMRWGEIILYCIVSCYIIWYHIMSCLVILYYVILCYIMYVTLYHIISYYIILYYIILHYIISYHITSYNMIRYNIM